MLQFDQFIARHGEAVAQALLENIERFEGVRADLASSLEDRWLRVMQSSDQRLAA
ncbi:MAG: hypothetical protein SFW62_04780 [Alphaproteobacteria bacterium]|nr:hypothetical protein [Alphaproteobacteria bacterium]